MQTAQAARVDADAAATTLVRASRTGTPISPAARSPRAIASAPPVRPAESGAYSELCRAVADRAQNDSSGPQRAWADYCWRSPAADRLLEPPAGHRRRATDQHLSSGGKLSRASMKAVSGAWPSSTTRSPPGPVVTRISGGNRARLICPQVTVQITPGALRRAVLTPDSPRLPPHDRRGAG